jgi:hypothetical protein
MYTQALQGHEALGLEFMSSNIPALTTMFNLGNLLFQTNRKDSAKVMYIKALSGFRTVQGPSSEMCQKIEDRLQALDLGAN